MSRHVSTRKAKTKSIYIIGRHPDKFKASQTIDVATSLNTIIQQRSSVQPWICPACTLANDKTASVCLVCNQVVPLPLSQAPNSILHIFPELVNLTSPSQSLNLSPSSSSSILSTAMPTATPTSTPPATTTAPRLLQRPALIYILPAFNLELCVTQITQVMTAGFQGVFLVNTPAHPSAESFRPLLSSIRRRFPQLWLGVNLKHTHHDPTQAFEELKDLSLSQDEVDLKIDALWTRWGWVNVHGTLHGEDSRFSRQVAVARALSGWKGLYFTGIGCEANTIEQNDKWTLDEFEHGGYIGPPRLINLISHRLKTPLLDLTLLMSSFV